MTRRDLQVGALCFRQTGRKALDILLVTSRNTGRWVIPKGWPEKGQRLHRAAAREALEEAGVSGDIGSEPLGEFPYEKADDAQSRLLDVSVYPLRVTKQSRRWPEDKERTRKWFPAHAAADKVQEPELAQLMRRFAKRAAQRKLP